MQGLIGVYLTSLVIVIAVAAYLLPTLVAWLRHAPDIAAVAVINIALGWTFIGWIVAFAMALRNAPAPAVQVFSQVNAPASPPPVNGYWGSHHFAEHPNADPRFLPPADAMAPPED